MAVLAKRRALLVPILMMAIALPTLIGLGIWQLRRLGEKQALLARIEMRTKLPPQQVTLKELIASGLDADQLDYTPLELNGRFLHEGEAHVFTNREEGAGQGFGGPGYDILTPFVAEGGGVILVDRGFVPDTRRDTLTRKAGQIEGQVSIAAIARRPERRTYLDVADDPKKNQFAIRDPRVILAVKLGDAPRADLRPLVDAIYLDLREPIPAGGLPAPNRTQIDIPNNHFQYALTWFGLALVFAGMFAVFLRSHFQRA